MGPNEVRVLMENKTPVKVKHQAIFLGEAVIIGTSDGPGRQHMARVKQGTIEKTVPLSAIGRIPAKVA